jgi:hypothetical protein
VRSSEVLDRGVKQWLTRLNAACREGRCLTDVSLGKWLRSPRLGPTALDALSTFACWGERLLFGLAAKSAIGFGHLMPSHICVPSFALRTSKSS